MDAGTRGNDCGRRKAEGEAASRSKRGEENTKPTPGSTRLVRSVRAPKRKVSITVSDQETITSEDEMMNTTQINSISIDASNKSIHEVETNETRNQNIAI